MATETVKEKKEDKLSDAAKFVCPFHTRVLSDQNRVPGELRFVKRISGQVTVDKENLNVFPVLEEVDLDAEIQTYKDMCGLEYFKLMLAQGKVNPEDSHDDGAHSYDSALMPKTIHEASKVADSVSAVVGEVAKQLGIKDGDAVSQEKLIELLSEKVAANIAAKSAKPGEGE